MRYIFKIAFLAPVIALSCMVCSCGNSSNEGFMQIVSERDSLRDLSNRQHDRLELISGMMNTINEALDSISEQEGLLFMTSDDDNQINRQDAINDLARYEMMLHRQQNKINELRAGLNIVNNGEEMKGLIEVMQQQLNAKDALIAQLKQQLSAKDVDIAKLRNTIATQQTTISQQSKAITELDRVNASQNKALMTQDKMMNQCYVLIATKKELQQKGVLKKGKVIAEALIDKSMMMKIDIRKAKEFAFRAKKPRILTNMPSSAYILTTGGDKNFILRVTNPTDFWSLSNILIIQTD